jgi:hypothetical protein
MAARVSAAARVPGTHGRTAGRSDPFAKLVGRVHEDPANAYNLDRYLWVLEELPPRACAACGTFFDPWLAYDDEPARGCPRRYCSRSCRDRASWARRRCRQLPRRQVAA